MEKQIRRRVIAYCILFISLIFGVTIILLPYFQRLSEPAYQAEIQRWVNNMGIVGLFKKFGMPPLLHDSIGTQYICLNSIIAATDLKAIHTKAKNCGATLNDVFMTAYACVIARFQNIDKVIIPCPADLRKFRPPSDSLTIANMTGIYRMIVVEITSQHSFNSILAQIHIEMKSQKSRYRCFSGIRILEFVYHKGPRSILRLVIKRGYQLLSDKSTGQPQKLPYADLQFR